MDVKSTITVGGASGSTTMAAGSVFTLRIVDITPSALIRSDVTSGPLNWYSEMTKARSST